MHQNNADYEFTAIQSNTIAGSFFVGIPPIKVTRSIVVIREPACETDIIPTQIGLYQESNGIAGNQPNELLATIYIYISKNSLKLDYLYKCSESNLNENEILLFLEDNSDDYGTQKLLIRFGSEKLKPLFLNLKPNGETLKIITELTPDFNYTLLKNLCDDGILELKSEKLQAIVQGMLWISTFFEVPKAVGNLVTQVGDLISNNLRITESFWDSKNKEYFENKEVLLKALQIDRGFLSNFATQVSNFQHVLVLVTPAGKEFVSSQVTFVDLILTTYNQFIEDVFDFAFDEKGGPFDGMLTFSERVAFFSGIWNGIIDFVADIFKFIGFIFGASFDITKNFDDLLNARDLIREAIENFSILDFFITCVKLYIDSLIEIKKIFFSENLREDYNLDRVAYTGGYGIAFLASLVIGGEITSISSISKFSKFIPDDFLKAINLKGKLDIKGPRAIMALIRDIAELLSKKGSELYNELKKIFDKIIEWFKANRKVFESKLDDVKKYLKKARRIRYSTTSMLKKYSGEATGSGWCAPSAVRYLDELERAQFELAIVDGKFYSAEGMLFDTTITKTIFSNQRAIFVMSKEGRIYASTSHIPKKFHHSSFLAGEAVASAGELKVINGVLVEVTRKSGHYRPTPALNNQFVKHLETLGIDIKSIKISDGL
ncbi:MAG TPA: hypothetical protein VF602_07585 [Pedobacter sp.]